MNEERNDFFQRIKEWVKENNTTIEDLMNSAIGISINVYNTWRKNKTELLPSATYIYRLAKYMGVSVEWLISGKEGGAETPPADGFQRRIGKAFKSLDDFDKETIAENAESLARRRLFPSRPIRILETAAEN